MSCSVNAAAVGDETIMKHRLQFSDSLKDLKNLRKQLYSAAEYFESSYSNNRDSHKEFVVESSKDYVAKALVNTVDHLGSVADKLNKFLDEKAKEFSSTNTQFSCIQQRLCTMQGFLQLRGMSQHLFQIEDSGNNYNKHTILQDKSFAKSFEIARLKPDDLPLTSKQDPTKASPIPNPPSFSFTNITPSKQAGAGRRSMSPLNLRFNTTSKRSISLSPSLNQGRVRNHILI